MIERIWMYSLIIMLTAVFVNIAANNYYRRNRPVIIVTEPIKPVVVHRGGSTFVTYPIGHKFEQSRGMSTVIWCDPEKGCK